MAAFLPSGRATGREVYFTTPDGDFGFARRFGPYFYGMDRWRGWRLCGVHNRRAGAALVSPDSALPTKLVRIIRTEEK